MVGFYFLMVLGIMFVYYDRLLGVFEAIFCGAFCWRTCWGAFTAVALTGSRRAMYVNEAGVGTAGIMHGLSMNAKPVREVLVGMLGPAIDSGFVCTPSAIPMIMVGLYSTDNLRRSLYRTQYV